MKFKNYSLAEMDQAYRDGRATYDEAREYVRAWNKGPHFTQAIIFDGRIQNMEIDRIALLHKSRAAEFGIVLD